MLECKVTFSVNGTGNQATELIATNERTTSVVPSDAGPDYTLMTRPGSDKIQRRLARQMQTELVYVDSDYLQPSSAAVICPRQRHGQRDSGTNQTYCTQLKFVDICGSKNQSV